MNKLTGNGRPTVYTHGEVGQFYEDQKTGEIIGKPYNFS